MGTEDPWAVWENTLQVGMEAPGWSLRDLDGNTHQLSDYRGRVVLLDFWAVYCSPCVAAIPTLQHLHETYAGQGLTVIGLNQGEPEATVNAFLEENPYTYTILMDAHQLSAEYGIVGIPSLFILDPAGIILEKHLGWEDGIADPLETAIVGYLAE